MAKTFTVVFAPAAAIGVACTLAFKLTPAVSFLLAVALGLFFTLAWNHRRQQ